LSQGEPASGRITDLITSEQLFHDIGPPPLDIESGIFCASKKASPALRDPN